MKLKKKKIKNKLENEIGRILISVLFKCFIYFHLM